MAIQIGSNVSVTQCNAIQRCEFCERIVAGERGRERVGNENEIQRWHRYHHRRRRHAFDGILIMVVGRE